LTSDPTGPDFAALDGLRKPAVEALHSAHRQMLGRCGGDWSKLQDEAALDALGDDGMAALSMLCAAYLLHVSPLPEGDPVARFHLDNGARLERINARANLSPRGLRQSFGMMVNYLYDLDKIEENHEAYFDQGRIAVSRTITRLLN
jgi:malonyl-CoA decarboxylase